MAKLNLNLTDKQKEALKSLIKSGNFAYTRRKKMMLRTAISCPDDITFVVDYCESGSTLDICTGAGSMISLTCIPPAKLKELRDILDVEIAKGARKHIFEKRK